MLLTYFGENTLCIDGTVCSPRFDPACFEFWFSENIVLRWSMTFAGSVLLHH